MRGRPAEAGGLGTAIAVIAAILFGVELDEQETIAAVLVVGAVPGAISALMSVGGIKGAVLRIWRGHA